MNGTENTFYPEEIVFSDHYSIVMVAFRHDVYKGLLGRRKNLEAYTEFLRAHGWKLHDYLSREDRAGCRRFQPDRILTPHAHEALFGKTLSAEGNEAAEGFAQFVRGRLDDDHEECSRAEPISFTRVSNGGPCEAFTLCYPEGGETRKQNIEIPWVDIHLFPDHTGILAFRVQTRDEIGIDRLSSMNREIRDFRDETVLATWGNGHDQKPFWEDVVGRQWLGCDDPITGRGKNRRYGVVLSERKSKVADLLSPYDRYGKLLVFARLGKNISDHLSLEWGRPVSDPPVHYPPGLDHEALSRGEWDLSLLAAQNSIIAGYATVRDMILFELASVSCCGAAVGASRGRAWQYSVEYVRKMVDGHFIEIWEYWSGIVFRDTCAFVSFDESMPITWQLESYYYPLYLAAFHCRFRMDILSEQIIDYDMADPVRGRLIRDEFQKFRNQYWFDEYSKDFQGHEVWEQYKKGLRLQEHYDAVASEVSEVSEHINEKWERGSRLLFAMLAIFFAPLMRLWDSAIIPWMKAAPVSDILVYSVGGGIAVLVTTILFRRYIYGWGRRLMRKFYRAISTIGIRG